MYSSHTIILGRPVSRWGSQIVQHFSLYFKKPFSHSMLAQITSQPLSPRHPLPHTLSGHTKFWAKRKSKTGANALLSTEEEIPQKCSFTADSANKAPVFTAPPPDVKYERRRISWLIHEQKYPCQIALQPLQINVIHHGQRFHNLR